MGNLDLTAFAGPFPVTALSFTVGPQLWAALMGALAASSFGILWTSLHRQRARQTRTLRAVPVRLVVPSRISN